MGTEQAQFVLKGMTGRQVADVVKERAKADESFFEGTERLVEQPLAGSAIRTCDAGGVVAGKRLDQQIGDVTGPEGVVIPGVCGARIDQIRLAELIDVAEVLERRMIDDPDFVGAEANQPVNGQEEFLARQSRI